MSSPDTSFQASRQPQRSNAIAVQAADWVARCDLGLSEAEKKDFERWSAIEAHREALARTKHLWSLLERPRETGAAGAMVVELEIRARRRAGRRRTLCCAGALAAAAILCFWLEPLRTKPEATRLASSQLGISQQRLPDGTTVDLKGDAEIDVQFSPAFRRVALVRGEALFHVTKNPARPFVVAAGGVEVRAVGTAFAVRFAPENVEVLVTEGRVSVDRSKAKLSAVASMAPHLAFVDAGQRVVVSRKPLETAGIVPVVESVTAGDIDQLLAWRFPRLEFSGTRLDQAVALFNRHSATYGGARLVIGDAELAKMEVSGFFRASNVDGFVRLLEGSFGVISSRNSAGDIVLRRGN